MLLVFIMTLLGCGGNDNIVNEIAQLEKEHSATPTSEVKRRLLSQYKNYLKDLDGDEALFLEVSNKAARLQMDLNKYADASITLKASVAKKVSADNVGTLSSLIVNQLHPNDFQTAVADFGKMYSDNQKMKSDFIPILDQLAQDMFDEKTGQWDREKANQYISMARLLGATVVKDKDVEDKLLKAARNAAALKKFTQTLNIYNYMIDHPDDFEKESTALFYKAYTYDENLKNLDKAKKYYEEFLEKFPDHPLAEDTKLSLKNLGKTPEEIIKSFSEK